MLGSRRRGGFSETDRSLPGETSDDIEVVADDLTPLQRHTRKLAENRARASGRALGFRCGQRTRDERNRPRRHQVDDHAGSLRPVGFGRWAIRPRPPVATAFLGPEQPSKDTVYVDFASVILFGDQVLGKVRPLGDWPAGRSRTETGPRS
jgi:hypothetical protein